jgi:hypothetical protein
MSIPWEIESALDNFKSCIERKVMREVDAGCCQTRRDWEKAHEAQEQAYEAEERLSKAIADALELHRKMLTR